MGRRILAIAFLIGFGIATITSSCKPSSPLLTPVTPPQTTAPPSTVSPSIQEPATLENVKLADPIDDLFNNEGGKVQGEPYLDIVNTEISLVEDNYVAKIKLGGALPSLIEAPAFIEWDVMVDSDCDSGTGWNDPVVLGNIGIDCRILLGLKADQYKASVHDIKSNTSEPIEYKADANTVEFQFPKSSIPVDNFNYTVVVRKYAKEGDAGSLVTADKAPNQGHCKFPSGCADLKAGLPTSSFESANATVFYNPGNEDIARWAAEAFELAYDGIGKRLGVFPEERFKVYVYLTQDDLVEGLQKFGNVCAESASYFKNKTTNPGPMGGNLYIMHLGPYINMQHEVAHEYTHAITQQISGKAQQSIIWLDEGLSDYLPYDMFLETKYREDELRIGQQYLDAVREAVKQGKFISLRELCPYDKWAARYQTPSDFYLQYYEAFTVVCYMAQKYGLDKCVVILKFVQNGDIPETAIQKALGISLSQLETDFKAYLQK